MATRVAFVIDVECRGDDAMRNGIISIGVCVGHIDRIEVLEKQRFDLKPMFYTEYLQFEKVKMQEFEERCLREFWSQHQDKLVAMQKNAINPLIAIRKFRNFLDKWDDKEKWEAVVISDNVTYDCRMVNYYLSVAGLASLSYDSKGSYRPNFDTDCYARGVELMDYASLWVNDSDIIEKYQVKVNKDSHDHFPENDAETIYRLHVSLVQKVSGVARKLTSK